MKHPSILALLCNFLVCSFLQGMKEKTYLDLLPRDVQKLVALRVAPTPEFLSGWASTNSADFPLPQKLGVKGYPVTFINKDTVLAAPSRVVTGGGLFVNYKGLQVLSLDPKKAETASAIETDQYKRIVVSPEATEFCTIGESVQGWAISGGRISKMTPPVGGPYQDVCYSADGKTMVFRSKRKHIEVYNRLPSLKTHSMVLNNSDIRNNYFVGMYNQNIVMLPFGKGFSYRYDLETNLLATLTNEKQFEGRAFIDPRSGNIYCLRVFGALSKGPLKIMAMWKNKDSFIFGPFKHAFFSAHTLQPLSSGTGLVGIARSQKKEAEDVISFYTPTMEQMGACYGSECAISTDDMQLVVANKEGEILHYDLNKLSLIDIARLYSAFEKKKKERKEAEEKCMKGRS